MEASSTFLLTVVIVVLVTSLNGFPLNSESGSVEWRFNVTLDQPLKLFERMFVTGNVESLGSWSPNRALVLSRTQSPFKWSGSVLIAGDSNVRYRYFVGVVDSMGNIQIRRWESQVDSRSLNLEAKNAGSATDRFGVIQDKKEIERGYLNIGNILQLKLFHNPIQINEVDVDGRLLVKVTPVNYDSLNPMLNTGLVNVEYVRMVYGNSQIRDQPRNGVPYDNNDIVLFHITTNEFQSIAYKFTVYEQDQDDPKRIRTLGFQYLYPDTIEGSEGSISLDLMSKDETSSVGTLEIDYLVINPLPSNELNLRTSFSNYWRDEWKALDVGHRGLGNSLELIKGAAPIIENTLASIKQAGVDGAEMVEFDVQMTNDYYPIIYHDFIVHVSASGEKPKTKEDLTDVNIKDMTYEELKNLVTYQIVGSEIFEYPSHNMEPREEYRMFPLFKDFLTKVDHDIGFDIEIKWPQKYSNGELESDQTIDKNLYADKILETMLDYGCGRLTFFSSLDADMCTLLQFKQNMYPVMFLGPDSVNFYKDPRSYDLEQVINNAQAMSMLGIVPHTSFFIEDGSQLDLATDLNLKTFIWGSDSNSTESVDYFKSLGATGVIYDRVDAIIPKGERSIFTKESDLPEFFEKQCN